MTDFATSIGNNPEFKTDVSQILNAVPTSVIRAAQTDPAGFVEDVVSNPSNTALLGSVPSSVILSLRRLLEKPIRAVEGVAQYVQQLVRDPSVTQGLRRLTAAVPQDVQQEIQVNPIPFLENLVTATTVPPYLAAVPTSVQEDLASILNKGLSIVESAFDDPTSSALSPPFPIVTGAPSATVPGGSGTRPPVVTATGGAGAPVTSAANGTVGGATPASTAVTFDSGAATAAGDVGVLGWRVAIAAGGVGTLALLWL